MTIGDIRKPGVFSQILIENNLSPRQFAEGFGTSKNSIISYCRNGVNEKMVKAVLKSLLTFETYGVLSREAGYKRSKIDGEPIYFHKYMDEFSLPEKKYTYEENKKRFDEALKNWSFRSHYSGI